MTARQPRARGLDYVSFEIDTGTTWLRLNDHFRYRLAADSFQTATHGRNRHMVRSSMYDGEWEVHSTASNVTEQVVVDILGADQNQVTEHFLALKEAVEQPMYNARKILDNHQETWRCFPAEMSIDRGHVFAHAVRMRVTLSIPRFPKVTYEVVT